jgi:uracil-DNA glycosylase
MASPAQPPHDCPLCPRLHAFRHDNRRKYPDWFNDPVPSFGPLTARILIAGLAPGLQGANRTGRPFTGDWAGDLLYDTLLKHGLAKGVYEERADDTLELVNCRILALGKIAHDSVCDTLGARKTLHPFKHGVAYEKVGKFTLISSYHCSRYNTNTGVLTPEMFEDVVEKAKKLAGI